MSLSFASHSCRTAQKHTSGFAPLVGVPAMKSPALHQLRCAGTPYPVQRTGSEFNELAPHMPEGLRAPRFAAAHQHRWSRSPPMLKGMARHGYPCCAPLKLNHSRVFRPKCSASEGT